MNGDQSTGLSGLHRRKHYPLIMKLYVDGFSTQSASGAGLLIMSSAGVRMERAVRFEFAAPNNEAEYEALLMGLKICHEAEYKLSSAKFSEAGIIGPLSGKTRKPW